MVVYVFVLDIFLVLSLVIANHFFGKRLISVNVYIYLLSFQRDRMDPTGNSVRDHIGNSFGNLEAFLSIKPSISATRGARATIKSSNY